MTNPPEMPRATILVTGGCGYLGSQLIRDLATSPELGDVTIRIFDNMQGGHYRALMNLPAEGRYQFIEGDLLDPIAARLALEGVDAVVHLAALVRTPMSFEDPAWVEQVNRWGTAHLLEYCLEGSVKRLIYLSTAAVYGPGGPATESDPCRPQGAYAQSKYRAETAVLSTMERGLQATIIRCGTLYGLAPVVRFDAVANRFAYEASTRRAVIVYGSGRQCRPLIHVRDASSAICFVLSQPEQTTGQVFNTVAHNTAIVDLAEIIRQIKPGVSVQFTDQDIRTQFSFEASNEKLVALGWQPRVSLKAGLTELVKQFGSFESIGPPALQEM